MQAGYDGAEIHAAHGYLLDRFYSPLTNSRRDAYGGTLENRLRLLREVIRAVRKAVGPGYTRSVRLGGCDYTQGGNTIRDAVEAVEHPLGGMKRIAAALVIKLQNGPLTSDKIQTSNQGGQRNGCDAYRSE